MSGYAKIGTQKLPSSMRDGENGLEAARQTTLVVEDEAGIRELVADLLEDEGYRVLEADCGKVALDILHETKPDLIISDVMMPGIDGFGLYEQVHADDAWSQIPFIFLTTRDTHIDRRRGMGLGADDYITKPFEPEELLSAVKVRLARAAERQVAFHRATARLRESIIGVLDQAQAEKSFTASEGRPANAQVMATQDEPGTAVARRAGPEMVVPLERHCTLRIHALGQPQVYMDGQCVQWPYSKCMEFYFCLLQHSRGLRREAIGAMFWPDHSPQKLDGIFRSTLYRLRQALYRDSVILDNGLYRIGTANGYWLDVEAFDDLLDRSERSRSRDSAIPLLERALQLYRGPYLEGVDGEWALVERERLEMRYLSSMEQLAGLYSDRGQQQVAIGWSQQVLAQDPYRETAHRELMRNYLRLGDRASAIRQYHTCLGILKEELGVSPSPETETLFLQIIA